MRLLIIGASARAAAASARRAGFDVTAIDRFGDADLAAIAEVVPWRGSDLAAALRRSPGVPWMYVGGIENRPALVRRLAARHPLWGVDAAALRLVRDPLVVQAAWRRAGLPFPETRSAATPSTVQFPPANEPWLLKQGRSAGGLGVQWVSSHLELDIAPTAATRRSYFQRYVAGETWGATFLADGRSAVLLGAARQTLCEPLDARLPFLYRGSIGPLPLAADDARSLETIGRLAASEFRLRGLFGVDVLRDSQGMLWTLEINPRYPAGVEVLERARGFSAVALHAAVCGDAARDAATVAPPPGAEVPPRRYVGKSVLYAGVARTIGARLAARWLEAAQRSSAAIADVPRAGARVEAGMPLCTVFAAGAALDEVEHRLRAERDRIDDEFRRLPE